MVVYTIIPVVIFSHLVFLSMFLALFQSMSHEDCDCGMGHEHPSSRLLKCHNSRETSWMESIHNPHSLITFTKEQVFDPQNSLE